MAEPILVTGKRISDMELVTVVVGTEKIPTGQVGDLAITPNQISDHTIMRGDLVSQEDLSQVEVDLTTQIATLAGDLAAEEAARIAADNLKVDKEGSVSSVAGRVGDVVLTPSDVLVEGFGSQENVNKYVAKPFLSGYTYGLGERVVLDDGEVVKSLVDGNVGDPNADMTGWVSVVSDSLSDTIQTFNTPEAGVDPVTGVEDGAYFNVRSEDNGTGAVEYQNISGVPTPTGKSYPSSAALSKIPHNDLLDRDLPDAHPASAISYGSGSVESFLNEDVLTSDFLRPYSGDEVDILIVYGQSNARGYAANSAGEPTYKTPLARVWNGTQFVEITSYTPTANDGTSTGSAWLAFADEYCTSLNRKLVVLNCAKGSQSIAELQKGTANYTAMVGWFNGAVSALASEGSNIGKVILAFNQGERDSQLATTPVVYTNALNQLWADIKTDFGASLMGLFTVGYYANSNMIHGQVIQQVQRLFARNNVDVILAYDKLGCFGSHNKLKVDGVHYNQHGYNIMGREGAKRIAGVLYPENGSPASDEQISRYGSLTMNQSQAWNLHAAVLRKSNSSGTWIVNHSIPYASSMIKSVDQLTDKLNVKLSCPARTILNFDANFGGLLQENGLRAVVGTGVNAASGMVSVDADGYSNVSVSFVSSITLRINMVDKTYDADAMGLYTGFMDAISVTFPSVGRCDIVHPTLKGLAVGSIAGSVGRNMRVNATTTSTIVQVRNAADALVNDLITIHLPNMLIPPSTLPDVADLSFNIIAADYAIW